MRIGWESSIYYPIRFPESRIRKKERDKFDEIMVDNFKTLKELMK